MSKVDLMEEEWDFCVVLDACRFDFFKEENPYKGTLEKIESPGDTTSTWFKRTFKDFYDVVYVSTLPSLSNKYGARKHFFKVEEVWNYGWDEELGTVPPETTVGVAEESYKIYGKPVIAHVMQPHMPYIGETKILSPENERRNPNFRTLPPDLTIGRKVWEGEIDLSLLKKAYRDNLRRALKAVEPLTNYELVITADHGELLGEKYNGKKMFFHAPPLEDYPVYIPEIREVPWFECEE